MYKLISYWTAPATDHIEAFEQEYESTHIPIARSVPLVNRMVLTRTTDGIGADPAFYRAVEMEWESKEDFAASLASPEWAGLIEDTVRLIQKYDISTSGALGEPQEYLVSNGRQKDTVAIDHILTTTRAVRQRLDLERPVPHGLLLECIRIAMQAPVGADREGPRWMVVTDPDKKLSIAEIYRAQGRDLLAEGVESTDDEKERRVWASALYLADNLERVPALVIPCVQGRFDTSTHPDTASSFGSILPAVWSLQLALRSRGMGSAWTTLHLWRADAVAELLGLPDDATQVALIPVAYTKRIDFKPAARPPAEERTFWNVWGATTPPGLAGAV